MFGSISGWFFQWLGGIQPAADAVAFDRIVIRPQLVGDLDWVKTTYPSVRGPITSNWKKAGKGYEFEIEIPADCTAVIELPERAGGAIEVDEAKHTELTTIDGSDRKVFRIELGSGTYLLKATP